MSLSGIFDRHFNMTAVFDRHFQSDMVFCPARIIICLPRTDTIIYKCLATLHRSHAPALIVIHKSVRLPKARHSGRDAGPVRARSEPSHMDVKLSALSLNLAPKKPQVAIHGTGYRHPCRYDDSWTTTMSATTWECSDRRSSAPCPATLERCRLNSHAGALIVIHISM